MNPIDNEGARAREALSFGYAASSEIIAAAMGAVDRINAGGDLAPAYHRVQVILGLTFKLVASLASDARDGRGREAAAAALDEAQRRGVIPVRMADDLRAVHGLPAFRFRPDTEFPPAGGGAPATPEAEGRGVRD